MDNQKYSNYDLMLEQNNQANELGIIRKEIEDLRIETRGVIEAFQAAQGAFTFLNGLAKVVKPILFIVSASAAFMIFIKTGTFKFV
jgi:hypothetical protein